MSYWKYAAIVLAAVCLVYPILKADDAEKSAEPPKGEATALPPGQYELFLIGPDGRKHHLQPMHAAPKGTFRNVIESYQGERYVLGVVVGDDDLMADGLVVKSLSEDMPAVKAGLQKDDRLFAVNGKPLKQPSDLVTAVNDLKGATVTLSIVRNGQPLDVQVTPVKIKEPIEQESNAWLQELPPDALRKLTEMGFQPGPQFLEPGVVLGSSQVNSRECLEFKIKVRQLEQQIHDLEKKVQALSERLPPVPAAENSKAN